MKKKILTLMILLTLTSCFFGILFHNTAKAEETARVNQITINQYPSKTTYTTGESLDFSDMVVKGYFYDGTNKIIKDYDILGFDSNKVGSQLITIDYQSHTAELWITVIPGKVTNVTTSGNSTKSISLTWDAFSGITKYEIYILDEVTGTYSLSTTTMDNRITFYDKPGTIHSYQVRAVGFINGKEYRGEFSDTYTAATDPEKVTGITITDSTTSSIGLTWEEVPGAKGYIIYRSPASITSYSYRGKTDSTSFTDEGLPSGRGYKYKVHAYTYDQSILGINSEVVEASTNPGKAVLNYKSGDKKIRLIWKKVRGATSYDIYKGDDSKGFSLVAPNVKDTSYVADGLVNGKTYSFYVIAHREYKGIIYDGSASDILIVKPEEIKATSTKAKYFTNRSEFENSWAYTNLEFFRKNVSYARSIVIPGLITTNAGGFTSTSMCPQGITYAEDYLLLTAYDRVSEENSVIYVMNGASKDLITTLVLQSKTHAGGISYDGSNIWIANGMKVSSIPFSEVEKAVKEGAPYSYVKYNTTDSLGITPSYMTFYDNKLWVGTYNELKSTNMNSYIIKNKDEMPTLKKLDTIKMPNRVQGVAFTSDGYLILSRSCQLYEGLRGYIRQLDIYKPNFSKKSEGVIPLGKRLKKVDMPSMNEEIAVDGSYLYVNFESAAFENSSFKMDRIIAFKLKSILP